jgi:hypothetical protein
MASLVWQWFGVGFFVDRLPFLCWCELLFVYYYGFDLTGWSAENCDSNCANMSLGQGTKWATCKGTGLVWSVPVLEWENRLAVAIWIRGGLQSGCRAVTLFVVGIMWLFLMGMEWMICLWSWMWLWLWHHIWPTMTNWQAEFASLTCCALRSGLVLKILCLHLSRWMFDTCIKY